MCWKKERFPWKVRLRTSCGRRRFVRPIWEKRWGLEPRRIRFRKEKSLAVGPQKGSGGFAGILTATGSLTQVVFLRVCIGIKEKKREKNLDKRIQPDHNSS
jgi:hypothetical protein